MAAAQFARAVVAVGHCRCQLRPAVAPVVAAVDVVARLWSLTENNESLGKPSKKSVTFVTLWSGLSLVTYWTLVTVGAGVWEMMELLLPRLA